MALLALNDGSLHIAGLEVDNFDCTYKIVLITKTSTRRLIQDLDWTMVLPKHWRPLEEI